MQRPDILRPFTLLEKYQLLKWIIVLGPLSLVTGIMLSAVVTLIQTDSLRLNLRPEVVSTISAPPVPILPIYMVPMISNLSSTSAKSTPKSLATPRRTGLPKSTPNKQPAPLPLLTKTIPPTSSTLPRSTSSLPSMTTSPSPQPQLSTPTTGLVTLPPSPTASSD